MSLRKESLASVFDNLMVINSIRTCQLDNYPLILTDEIIAIVDHFIAKLDPSLNFSKVSFMLVPVINQDQLNDVSAKYVTSIVKSNSLDSVSTISSTTVNEDVSKIGDEGLGSDKGNDDSRHDNSGSLGTGVVSVNGVELVRIGNHYSCGVAMDITPEWQIVDGREGSIYHSFANRLIFRPESIRYTMIEKLLSELDIHPKLDAVTNSVINVGNGLQNEIIRSHHSVMSNVANMFTSFSHANATEFASIRAIQADTSKLLNQVINEVRSYYQFEQEISSSSIPSLNPTRPEIPVTTASQKIIGVNGSMSMNEEMVGNFSVKSITVNKTSDKLQVLKNVPVRTVNPNSISKNHDDFPPLPQSTTAANPIGLTKSAISRTASTKPIPAKRQNIAQSNLPPVLDYLEYNRASFTARTVVSESPISDNKVVCSMTNENLKQFDSRGSVVAKLEVYNQNYITNGIALYVIARGKGYGKMRDEEIGKYSIDFVIQQKLANALGVREVHTNLCMVPLIDYFNSSEKKEEVPFYNHLLGSIHKRKLFFDTYRSSFKSIQQKVRTTAENVDFSAAMLCSIDCLVDLFSNTIDFSLYPNFPDKTKDDVVHGDAVPTKYFGSSNPQICEVVSKLKGAIRDKACQCLTKSIELRQSRAGIVYGSYVTFNSTTHSFVTPCNKEYSKVSDYWLHPCTIRGRAIGLKNLEGKTSSKLVSDHCCASCFRLYACQDDATLCYAFCVGTRGQHESKNYYDNNSKGTYVSQSKKVEQIGKIKKRTAVGF